MAVTPSIVAMNEMVGEATNGRMDDNVKRFSKASLGMKALIAGDLSIHTASPDAVYNVYAGGSNARVIATNTAGTDYVLVVRDRVNDLQHFENSDLRFGISSPNSIGYVQAAGVMNKEGVNIDKVNLVSIGGSSARTKAIAADNIDGAALHIGQFKRLQEQDVKVKSLGKMSEWFPNFIQDTITVSSSFLEDSTTEAFTAEFVNQLAKSFERANNDFDWVYEKTQKYQAQTLDEEKMRGIWKTNTEVINSWPHPKNIDRDGYQATLDAMTAAGLLDADDVDIDEILVPKYFKQATQ